MFGIGKKKISREAVAGLEAKALAGEAAAYENLYECYRYGWGTSKDFKKARAFLEAATKAKRSKPLKHTLKVFTRESMRSDDGEARVSSLREFYN